jgi:signal transduction histidine kinase
MRKKSQRSAPQQNRATVPHAPVRRPERLSRLNRWSERHRQVLDAIKALLLVLLFMILESGTSYQAFLVPQNEQTVIVWTLVYAIPLAVRRTHADAGALIFVLLAALQIVFGPVLIIVDLMAPVMLYSAIVYGKRQRALRYILIALAMGVLTAGLNAIATHHPPFLAPASSANGDGLSSYATWDAVGLMVPIEVLLLSAAAMGYWRRARRNQLALLHERNLALERGQQEESHIAALAERSRIARDMHDVVAHTLSIIIVQADGGRYAGANDPDIALTTMHTIRDEANHALSSMNGLLGTLGEDEALKRQKQHSITAEYSSIDALVHQAQAASRNALTIERTVHGTPPRSFLNGQLSEALFRTVQEALSNVRKYAGQGVHVDIVEWWSAQGVTLTITDDGQGAHASADGHRPGYGLIGMNERITSLGGTLQAGPRGASREDPTHGFSLTAAIPLTRPSDEGAGTGRSNNFVERISVWTQSHFALVDLLITLLLTALLTLGRALVASSAGTGPSVTLQIIFTLAFCLPLAMRRTRPQLSAAAIAGFLILSMLVGITTASMRPDSGSAVPGDGAFIALFALYSVILYGPKTAHRWVYPTCLCIIGLAMISVGQTLNSENITASTARYSPEQIAASCIGTGVVIAASVLATIFFALWKRAKGADIVLLRAREDALLQQRERAAALAANLERARISEQIQHEVTHTLGTVLNSANSWLVALRAIEAASSEGTDTAATPALSRADKDTIQTAFSDIATTGRQALAQMRELLGILRQNETPADANRPQLRPIMEATPATQQDGTAYHDDFSEHS